MIRQQPLTTVQEDAALAVAEDKLTDEQIASACGVKRLTIARWRLRPDFIAAVENHRRLWREKVQAEGIANKQNRIDALNDRWRRMQRIIDARSVSPTPKEENGERGYEDEEPIDRIDVPGWDTGLLVKVVRVAGKSVEIRYELDAGILKELREHEKQAAQESGQWTEKRELSGKDGTPLVPVGEPFDYDAYARSFAALVGAAGADALGPDGDSEPLDTADPDR